VRLVAGDTSPLGWPYSAFTDAVVDAAGRLVFSANSSGIFGGRNRSPSASARATCLGRRPHRRRGRAGAHRRRLRRARATFAQGRRGARRACGTARLVLLDTRRPKRRAAAPSRVRHAASSPRATTSWRRPPR
jgi:hypothetical protein